MRKYIFSSQRIGFSLWDDTDVDLAYDLWSDKRITRFIGGPFDKEYVEKRLKRERSNYENHGVQYFPVFELGTEAFLGCIGLKPELDDDKIIYEIGVHLLEKAQGKGYGYEGMLRAMAYAKSIGIDTVYAGHHPENNPSRGLLKKLGFQYLYDELYEPTGLDHPFYIKNLK